MTIIIILLYVFAIGFNFAYAVEINGAKLEKNPIISFFWEKVDFVGVAAIILTIFLFDFDRRKKEGEMRIQSRNLIINEMSLNLDFLRKDDERVFYSLLANKKTVNYIDTNINTYAFQNLIQSGLFIHLPEKLQEALFRMYNAIEIHNKNLNYRKELYRQLILFVSPENFHIGRIQIINIDFFLTDKQGEILDLLSEALHIIKELVKKNLI